MRDLIAEIHEQLVREITGLAPDDVKQALLVFQCDFDADVTERGGLPTFVRVSERHVQILVYEVHESDNQTARRAGAWERRFLPHAVFVNDTAATCEWCSTSCTGWWSAASRIARFANDRDAALCKLFNG